MGLVKTKNEVGKSPWVDKDLTDARTTLARVASDLFPRQALTSV
jgi:hypothetical protein